MSGISHAVTAIGIDDKGKRIVIVSGEHDAKSAALSQVYIQLTMPDVRVCVIRPVLVSLPQIASALVDVLGSTRLYFSRVKLLNKPYFQKIFKACSKEFMDNSIGSITKKFKSVLVSILGQIQYVMQQLVSEETAIVLNLLVSKKTPTTKMGTLIYLRFIT